MPDAGPRLLFITPVHPDPHGNGLSMRAALFLEALSAAYRVSLLVVPLFAAPGHVSDEFARQHCDQVHVIEPDFARRRRFGLRGWSRDLPAMARVMAGSAGAAARVLDGQHFDVFHVFRLYGAPLALALARRQHTSPPALHLDLDDIESSTHASLAARHRLNRRFVDAAREIDEAERYARLEERCLPLLQRVYVCSLADAEAVRPQVRGELRVAPNAVAPPAEQPEALTTHPFTFLFVGTLSYAPNEDAVNYFCRQVLPHIRLQTPESVRVRIVGRAMPASLRPLSRIEGVRLIGDAADLAREYADADAVVVPLRAGGGTRIKVLEAFVFNRPVVSTSIGVEGIDVADGEHCLVADSPQAFAAQCARLMRDRELGLRLAASAYELVTQRYSPAVVCAAISGS